MRLCFGNLVVFALLIVLAGCAPKSGPTIEGLLLPHHLLVEHGITVSWALLKEVFPNASLVPITIKPGTSQGELDRLIEGMMELEIENTLVVASIDFSHYVPEEIAVSNDTQTVGWLESLSSTTTEPLEWYEALQILAYPNNLLLYPDAVAMDSPESLYVLARLMDASDSTTFILWKRTSSASLTGITDPTQNTSHLFGWFE